MGERTLVMLNVLSSPAETQSKIVILFQLVLYSSQPYH